MQTARRSKGFTLVEIIIVIAIAAILAAAGIPSYNEHIRKSKRSVAKGVLMDTVNRQEQFFANNKTYSNTWAGLAAPDPYYIDGSGDPVTSNGVYQLTIEVTGSAPYLSYTLKATPVAGSPQAADSCGVLSITSDGQRSASQTTCW